jgi:hypothetical protein
MSIYSHYEVHEAGKRGRHENALQKSYFSTETTTSKTHLNITPQMRILGLKRELKEGK